MKKQWTNPTLAVLGVEYTADPKEHYCHELNTSHAVNECNSNPNSPDGINHFQSNGDCGDPSHSGNQSTCCCYVATFGS